MTDIDILHECIRLVDEGVSVTLPVRGNSMLPFIVGDRESVVLASPQALRRGDVVLAFVEGQRYVVHRIVAIDGQQLTLMGDGNIAGTEHCNLSDVKAKATHVVDRNGHQHYLYTRWRRWAARLWLALRPIRRYLLFIYRKL